MSESKCREFPFNFRFSSNNFPIEFHHENNNKGTIYLEKENGKIKWVFPRRPAMGCCSVRAINKIMSIKKPLKIHASENRLYIFLPSRFFSKS